MASPEVRPDAKVVQVNDGATPALSVAIRAHDWSRVISTYDVMALLTARQQLEAEEMRVAQARTALTQCLRQDENKDTLEERETRTPLIG